MTVKKYDDIISSMKKVLAKIYTSLFTVCAFIFFGFVAIMIPANSPSFYKSQFEKYYTLDWVQSQHRYLDGAAADYIENLTDEQLLDLMMHTVRYCLYLEDDLNVTVDGEYLEIFREDEYSHMRDVKGVFGGGLILVLISVVVLIAGVVLFLIYKKGYYDNCRKIPYYTLACLFALLLFVALYAAIDFDTAFTVFHQILFDGNWIFSNGVMIAMIGEIFYDIVPIIAAIWMGLLVLFVAGIVVFNKLYSQKQKSTKEPKM